MKRILIIILFFFLIGSSVAGFYYNPLGDMSINDFKDSCKTIDYKELYADEDGCKGENITIHGKISIKQETAGTKYFVFHVDGDPNQKCYVIVNDTEYDKYYEGEELTIYGVAYEKIGLFDKNPSIILVAVDL